MEIPNFINIEALSRLPLIFQTLKATPVDEVKNAKERQKKRCISIAFYQTEAFIPYSHYKPISKIFSIENE